MIAVQPPSDWLERASRTRTCPLCLACGQYESDCLGAFCDRLRADGGDAVSGAALRDLCAEHLGAFGSTSPEGGLSLDATAAVYLRRLDDLAGRLAELDHDGWLTVGECGLCLGRDALVACCASRLLVGLAHRANPAASRLRDAGGLCARHFAICWETTSTAGDREALRRIQLDAVRALAGTARSTSGAEHDDGRVRSLILRVTAITAT